MRKKVEVGQLLGKMVNGEEVQWMTEHQTIKCTQTVL